MTEQIGVFARRTPSGDFLPEQPIMREVPEEREQAAPDYIDEQLAKIFIDFMRPYVAEMKRQSRRAKK